MKLKLKKLVALLVTSFIGVTSICPAFAAKSEDVSSVLVETEDCSTAKDEFMEDIDTVITLIKMNLGRDNIDISNAAIGQPFLVANSNVYIFPVLIDGKIERLIQMTEADSENNYFAISHFFADNLNNLSNDTYKIAADENFDVFAINDEEAVLIDKNTDNEESIIEPVMSVSDEDLDTVDVKDTFVDLGSIPALAADPVVDANGSGEWLFIPIVKQTENTCWAACMSSIMKYHGDNVSLSQILSKTGRYGTADSSEVKEFFSIYNYSSVKFGSSSLTFDNIKTEIKAGRPIWQAISGHAVVIGGYQEKGTGRYNAISIMDPYKASIVDCSYLNNNTFSYYERPSHEGLYKIK